MPYLILGDIHANLEALHAVLDDAKGLYEKIFCLGDLVGYGANPNEIVDWARSNVNAIVRGNHDKDCSRDDSLEHYRPIAAASAIWTRKQLTQTSVDYLRGLPRGPLRVDDFDLVHGSPGDEDEYLLMNSDAAAQLPFLEARATFFGHTHVQGGFLIARSGAKTVAPETFQLEPDHFYLLNPGAVGQPRDGDSRAAYLLYHPKERLVEYRRVEYNIPAAARKILDAGLPDALAYRLTIGA